MKKAKQTKKIISLILTFLILFSVSATPISLAVEMLNSTYYKIDSSKNIISRVEPETKVEEFKIKMNADESELKLYQDKTCAVEVTTGLVGTGMALKYNDEIYEISVVGDFLKNGRATQIGITNIIRHIVGITGAELQGIYYESADLTGDGLVDQRDITKFIRYIVYGELDLGKQDTTPPVLTLNTKDIQASSATVVATALDKESGMGNNPIFTFYLKKASEPDTSYIEKQKGANNEFNITGLISNTEYEVKAVTQDKAGNKAEKTIKFTTKSIEGTLAFSNETWNAGVASIDIISTTSYTIEYQINSNTGSWITGTSGKVTVNNLNHNDIIYARLTNGVEQTLEQTIQITDAEKPEVTLSLSSGTQKITATAQAQDNESGIASDATYKFSIKEAGEDDSTYVEKQNTTSNTCEFTNLVEGKKYTVKVEVEDKAGNVGTKEVSKQVTDNIAPVVTLTVTSKTSNSITAIASATDVGGMPTNPTYVFYIKKTDEADTSYTQKQSSTSTICTFDGLDANTNYTIKVTVDDSAGNEGVKEVSTLTETIPDGTVEGAITFGSITWSSGTASVQISTTSSYYIEYQVNGTTGTWTKGTTVSGLNHGDIVYARLTDGSNASDYANVTITDAVNPQITLNLVSGTQKITAIAVATDNESGIASDATYKFSIKEAGEDDSAYVEKQNTTSNICEFTDLVEAKEYTIKVEVEDKAGNVGTKETTKQVTDDIAPVVTLNVTSKTSNSITSEASATDVGGMPANPIYVFYIKKTNEADTSYIQKQSSTSTICTFDGLDANTNYTIKVTVDDSAGNEGTKEVSSVTDRVPGGTETGAITFGSTTWTSGTASVQISTTSSYYIEYQVNGTTDGTWTKASSAGTAVTVSNLNHNDVVYARLTDGSNASDYSSITIADAVAPTAATISTSDVTDEAVTVTITTASTDSQTGLKDYTYVAEKADGTKVEVKNKTALTYTITGLSEQTDYKIYVIAYDKAGNPKKSNEVAIKTEAMPVSRLFGQYVNYIDLDYDATTPDWQVFYKEDGELNPDYEGATYIIPKYYVPYSKMTTSIANAGMSLYLGTYRVIWQSVPNAYVKMSNYNTIKQVFMYDYTGESNDNVKCVSTLLYTDYWKDDFVTPQLQAKGGLAIGGPTINMWCASWNKAYPTEQVTPTISGTGYLVNGSDTLNLSSYTGYTSAPNVYFPTKSKDSDGTGDYRLASPSSYGSYNLMSVSYGGLVYRSYYEGNSLGVRPLVYLPSSVTLEPSGTANVWNINYGD